MNQYNPETPQSNGGNIDDNEKMRDDLQRVLPGHDKHGVDRQNLTENIPGYNNPERPFRYGDQVDEPVELNPVEPPKVVDYPKPDTKESYVEDQLRLARAEISRLSERFEVAYRLLMGLNIADVRSLVRLGRDDSSRRLSSELDDLEAQLPVMARLRGRMASADSIDQINSIKHEFTTVQQNLADLSEKIWRDMMMISAEPSLDIARRSKIEQYMPIFAQLASSLSA